MDHGRKPTASESEMFPRTYDPPAIYGRSFESEGHTVGEFKGPVFLRIQTAPGAIDGWISTALHMGDWAHYEYDPQGSWLTFASPRDVMGFVRDLLAYAQDADSQEIDPDGCANAVGMADVLERAVER